MSGMLLAAVIAGLLFGRAFLPQGSSLDLSTVAYGLLLLVLGGVGFELGQTKGLLSRLRSLKWQAWLLPLLSAVGSLVGGLLAGLLLGMGVLSGLTVAAGFGWYSLSSVLIAEFGYTELAAVAFLANVIREIVAIVAMPLLFKWHFGLAAVTAGGATTMDTTLAVIARAADQETTVLAFYHGLVLSLLVPLLVPALVSIL